MRVGGPPVTPPGIYRPDDVPQPDGNVTKLEDQLVQATGQRNLDAHFPRRPGYGTMGKAITLRTNYFELSVSKNVPLYRYRVAAQFSGKKQKDENGNERDMPKGALRRLLNMLMAHPMFNNMTKANDGGSFIVTNKKADLGDGGVFSGKLVLPGPGENAFPPPTDDESEAKKLARAKNEVSFKIESDGIFEVQDFIDKLRSSKPITQEVYDGDEDIIQLLNVLICRVPNEDPDMAAMGKNRFVPLPGHRLVDQMDLGDGLVALRGYYSSARPATGRILVNLNVKPGAFYKGGPLLELYKEIKGNGRDDDRRFLQTLEKFLYGLQVETSHRDGPKLERISGLGDQPRFGTAKNVKFEFRTDNKPDAPVTRTSVADFFKQTYKITVQGELPVINVGNRAHPRYLPLEICTVPRGQQVRGFLSPNQTTLMLRFAARNPKANAETIEGKGDTPGVALQAYGLHSAAAAMVTAPLGLNVAQNMITIPGRILIAPMLNYKKQSGQGSMTEQPRGASWNLARKAFHKPGRFNKFSSVMLNLNRPSLRSDHNAVVRALLDALKGYNIQIGSIGPNQSVELGSLSLDKRSAVNQQLDATFRGAKQTGVDVMLIIIPSQDKWLYSRIKLYGDVIHGIHTICCQGSILDRDKGQQILFGNLALKFNIKGDGIGHTISPNDLADPKHVDADTMLVGIDVTHPSPDSASKAPSISAVVANKDQHLTGWPGSVRTQTGKKEMVSGLKEMVIERLQCWKRHNNQKLPKKIIIYRDGVSEGQFGLVLSQELPVVYDAFKGLYKDMPKITLIVCNKRHNTRAFPTKDEDADQRNNFNCQPGTVFDRGITQSKYWEFFLQAHAALQGTAKSARYIVLLDQIGFGKDEIQKFTHNLCYMFNRATKAISVCPPAYYADLLCERGRMYLYSTMEESGKREEYNPQTAEWVRNAHEKLVDTTWYV